MELFASVLSLTIFVPWLLIVLIPFTVIVWGGTYILFSAGGCKPKTDCNVFELPQEKVESYKFESFNDFISA